MKKIISFIFILFLTLFILDGYTAIDLPPIANTLLLNMKSLPRYVFIILFLLFILDQCTTINITSAGIFKKKEYDSYKYLKDGVESDQYVLNNIVSDSRYSWGAILYDTKNNFFVVNDREGLRKINAEGEVVKLIKSGDEIDFPFRSHYAFTDSLVYDLSKEIVQKESFKTIVEPPKKISEKGWLEIFESYYHQADIVIFGNQLRGKDKPPIYFKIGTDWTLLYMTRYFYESSARNKERYMKGYSAKYNRLILLKDQVKKVYSDGNSTKESDQDMQYEYPYGLIERKLKYPRKKIKTLFFQKTLIYDALAYISIPISLGGTAYYSIKTGNDVIKFKENATKSVLPFTKVKNHLYYYSLPKAYKNKSDISFLKMAYPSNINASGSEGIFILKKK